MKLLHNPVGKAIVFHGLPCCAAARLLLICTAMILQANAQDLLNMKGVDRPVAAPLKHVGIDQKLDSQVPLDLQFKDETGKTVRLGDYFGKRPVILAPVY